MKNQDRYKTVEERKKAFDDFCEMECIRCPIHGDSTHGCFENPMEGVFIWLELEADDEKPLPCPFCGDSCYSTKRELGCFVVSCSNGGCNYCSGEYDTDNDAIAAHNKVARKCMGSEVNK